MLTVAVSGLCELGLDYCWSVFFSELAKGRIGLVGAELD